MSAGLFCKCSVQEVVLFHSYVCRFICFVKDEDVSVTALGLLTMPQVHIRCSTHLHCDPYLVWSTLQEF